MPAVPGAVPAGRVRAAVRGAVRLPRPPRLPPRRPSGLLERGLSTNTGLRLPLDPLKVYIRVDQESALMKPTRFYTTYDHHEPWAYLQLRVSPPQLLSGSL